MITEIKFDCKHCGQPLAVDSDAAGMMVTCPGCESPIEVPRGDMALAPAPRRERRPSPEALQASDPEALTLRQRLVDANVHASRLEGEVAKARAETAAARQRFDEMARRVQEFEALLGEQQAAIERSRMEAAAHRETWESAVSRMRGLESDLAAANELLREAELGSNDLRAQLAAARAELAGVAEVAARLPATEEKLAALSRLHAATAETLLRIEAEAAGLRKDRDDFHRTLSGDSAGQDFIQARERLQQTETERTRLVAQVERLLQERDAAVEKRRGLEEQIRSLLKELDAARREIEAHSEHHLEKENAVLRGIIERQNSQLEQQHVQVRRLRRAQYGVRLAYAIFGFGLVALAWWALQTVTGAKAALPF
jgi:chromosome segregation ATPase/DNA-directed RNA polymerase subunit RPC12/RpoP